MLKTTYKPPKILFTGGDLIMQVSVLSVIRLIHLSYRTMRRRESLRVGTTGRRPPLAFMLDGPEPLPLDGYATKIFTRANRYDCGSCEESER
jgi:hypothetical protein